MYAYPISFEDVAGFTFQAENICTEDARKSVIDIMDNEGISYPKEDMYSVHDMIWHLALARNEKPYMVDMTYTYDVAAFDSDSIPKAFESASVDDGETCDVCGREFD